MPDFSVVITTHKRPLLLSRAIQSLKSQAGADVQIVVVSDTPCVDTYGIVSAMLDGKDRFLQRAGEPGPAASRNAGLANVDAAYTMFLDDDDAFTEDFFRQVSPHLMGTDVVYTDYHSVFERMDGQVCTPVSAERRRLGGRSIDDLHVKNFIPLHCLVYPTEIARRCAFDSTLKLNEDWDFLLAVARETSFRHVEIDGPIVHSRAQADNRGRSNDHLLVETYRRIYARWPAPTQALAKARIDFFAANGLDEALLAA